MARQGCDLTAAVRPLVLSGKRMTQMEMKMTETTTCAHHWVIEPARGARSAGVCKLCGAARNDFANSDRSQAAGPGPQPPELGDRRRGRYTERVLLSVSTAQRISYRRTAEDAGVGLTPWCRRVLESAAAGASAPPSRPTGACNDRVEITMTPEQEAACRAAANRSGQDLAEWMREALDSAVKEKWNDGPAQLTPATPLGEPETRRGAAGPVHGHSPGGLDCLQEGLSREGSAGTARGFVVGPDADARSPDPQPRRPGWSSPCRRGGIGR